MMEPNDLPLFGGHERWMRQALVEAQRAEDEGEVPVGAVVVYEGRVVGRGHNRTIATRDATAHAEVMALGAAGDALGDWRLNGAQVYVSLEPCIMCAGALVLSRVGKVIFGPRDPKFGGAGSILNVFAQEKLNHHVESLEGVLAEESRSMLQEFFRRRRRMAQGADPPADSR